MARAAQEDLDGRLLHRLLFFTDAVFAIVLTLMALELHPPHEATTSGMLRAALGGPFFAFALSFAIVGVFWLAHLSTTRVMARFDWLTAAANLAFLLPICLIPFVSAWVGEGPASPMGWGAYSLVMIATSLANVVLALVQTRDGGRLLAGAFTPRERAFRLMRAASPGIAFTVGLLGALSGRAWVAAFCWVLIPPLMLLARMLRGPRSVAQPAAKPRRRR